MASFLFATIPVPAHTRNALPFAARLVERGHDVRWMASRRFHASIAAVGATPLPHATMRDYDGTRLAEEFPRLAGLRGPRAIGRVYADVFVGEAPARVVDLRRVLESHPVDAMLCDGLSYGVALLGETLDVPVATFGDGPLPRAHGATPAYGPGLLPMRGPVSRLRNHAVRSASRWWVFGEASGATTGSAGTSACRRTGARSSRPRCRPCCTSRAARRRSSMPRRTCRGPCTGWVPCGRTRRANRERLRRGRRADDQGRLPQPSV